MALRRGARRACVWALAAACAWLALQLARGGWGAGVARAGSAAVARTPAALAHYLADFNNLRLLLDIQLESWGVEEEWSNYTRWRYTVRYRCGARCAGTLRLLHAERHSAGGAAGAGAATGAGTGAARHGHAPAHRLTVAHARCTRLALLPWPELCEEEEVEAHIEPDGAGGARYSETAVARCDALAALSGACGARLNDSRARFLARLHRALPALAPPPPPPPRAR